MSGRGPAPERRASVEEIKRVVASHFRVAVWMFAERRKTGDIVLARQVAMYLAYRFTILSNRGIGRRFGGLDHSTVVHARQLVERRRHADGEFAGLLRAIERDVLPPLYQGPEVQLALFVGPLFDRPFRSSCELELAA